MPKSRPESAEESLDIVRQLSEHKITRSPYAILVHFVKVKDSTPKPIFSYDDEKFGSNRGVMRDFMPLRDVAVRTHGTPRADEDADAEDDANERF